MAQLKDTIVRGNLYVSEDIQIGDISILDALAGIEEGGSIEITQTQSDWEENDEAASSYIKNRPFYVSDNILDTVTSLDQTEISGFTQNDGCYGITENIGELLIEGAIYDVTWDGIVHRGLNCHEDKTINNGYKCLTIGSKNESFTDYPFKITTYDDGTDVCYIIKTDSTTESHIVKVVGNIPEIKKIDKKFLPDDIGSSETMDIVYDEKEQILEFVNKTPLPKDISVDPSLSTRGDAADAKVVGDRFEALEEILENGVGISSWNDLTDKPFYEDGVKEIVVIEEFSFEGEMYQGETNVDPLVLGDIYKVVINGETYDNVLCKDMNGIPVIGYIDGDESTYGYPFIVAIMDGFIMVMCMSDATNTIKVLNTSPNIKTIDEKFLPKSVLAQSDWEQNDKSNYSFIKNRPFYSEETEENIMSYPFGYLRGGRNNYKCNDFKGTVVSNFELDRKYFITVNDVDHPVYLNIVKPGDYYYFGAPYDQDTDTYDFSEYNVSIIIKRSDEYMMNCIFAVPKDADNVEYKVALKSVYTNHKKIYDGYLINPDWNENDPRKASCIINKPFGDNISTGEYESVIFDGEIILDDFSVNIEMLELPVLGAMYDVFMDDTLYTNLVCYTESEHASRLYIGQDNSMEVNLNIPFSIDIDSSEVEFRYDPTSPSKPESVYLKVYKHKCKTKKLDDKYLPQSDWDELDDEKGTFVANKPFGEFRNRILTPIISELQLDPDNNTPPSDLDNVSISAGYVTFNLTNTTIQEGETYTVIFKGKEYHGLKCYKTTETYNGDFDTIGASSGTVLSKMTPDVYPFTFKCKSGENKCTLSYRALNPEIKGLTFSLYHETYETKVKKIDPKYIPSVDEITETLVTEKVDAVAETIVTEKINAIFKLDGTTLTITTI